MSGIIEIFVCQFVLSFLYICMHIYVYLFNSRVYGCKLWNEIAVYNDHTGTATGVRFGQNASFIASTSLDRSLKIYGEQQ